MIFKETLEEKSTVIWDGRGGERAEPVYGPWGQPSGERRGGHGLWSSEEGHVDQRGIRGGGQQEPDPAGPRGPQLGGSGFIPEAPGSHRRLESRGVMHSDPADDSDLGVLQEEGLEEAREWAVLTQTVTALSDLSPSPPFYSLSLSRSSQLPPCLSALTVLSLSYSLTFPSLHLSLPPSASLNRTPIHLPHAGWPWRPSCGRAHYFN